MSARSTILVLRALGLGDFMTGLPALALLRRERPEHEIVLAAPLAYEPLALLAGCVDRVVAAHELNPISGPPRRPVLAIDLHGNGHESRRLLDASAPRRVLAFDGGPRWRTDEHEVHRWCRLLIEGLPAPGAVIPNVVGALSVPPAESVRTEWRESGRTVVHCGAKSQARRWPAPRLSAVARKLSEAGHDVVVTGGPRETSLAVAIARDAGVAAACDLTLSELCTLVAGARVVISGDTGVAHVATNYAVPSVVLFGPVSPAVWGPPKVARHQVLWKGDGRGDPHGVRPDPALLEITVDEVMSATERALAATREEATL